MDISLVNNMPKFKIIDHGYNFSTTRFMLNEEGEESPKGKKAINFLPNQVNYFQESTCKKVDIISKMCQLKCYIQYL